MQKIKQTEITELLEEQDALSKREIAEKLGCTHTEAHNALVRGHLAGNLRKVPGDHLGEPPVWRLTDVE